MNIYLYLENDKKTMKQTELRKLIREEIKKSGNLYRSILDGNVTYSDILERLTHDVYNDLRKLWNVPFGNGRFEKWLEDKGYQIKSSDIKEFNADEVASLMANVFYNKEAGSLSKFAPDKMVEKIIESKAFEEGVERGNILPNVFEQKAKRGDELAEYALDVINDIES